jgi:predicted transcriptional regulator
VLRLVAQGRSNREIAAELSIAEKTARNHIDHVYAKLGVINRTQPNSAHRFRSGGIPGQHDRGIMRHLRLIGSPARRTLGT